MLHILHVTNVALTFFGKDAESSRNLGRIKPDSGNKRTELSILLLYK